MNTSTELVPVRTTTEYYKARVTESYAAVNERCGEFLRAVISFGALLDEIGGFLGESRGRSHDGECLQSWLAENCPEVNYKTAMGYKALAVKAARMIGGGTMALAALQGRDTVTAPGTGDVVTVDAEVIEKREELFKKADSRRKLEQLYFDFMAAPRRRGRKKGEKHAPAKVSTPMDDARTLFARLVVCAGSAGLFDSIALWNAEMLQAADRALSPILAEVKKRLADIR